MRIAFILIMLFMAGCVRYAYMEIDDTIRELDASEHRWNMYACLGADQRAECTRVYRKPVYL